MTIKVELILLISYCLQVIKDGENDSWFTDAGTPTVQIRAMVSDCSESRRSDHTPLSCTGQTTAPPLQSTQTNPLTGHDIGNSGSSVAPGPSKSQVGGHYYLPTLSESQLHEILDHDAFLSSGNPGCEIVVPATLGNLMHGTSGHSTLSVISSNQLGAVFGSENPTFPQPQDSLVNESSINDILPGPSGSPADEKSGQEDTSVAVEVESSHNTSDRATPIQVHDTLEQPRPPTSPQATAHDTISIHRSRVLQEMISVFMDPAILVSSIKYQFIDEKGADAQGVSREVYSSFWEEFFKTSSVGENERVPAIFPENRREEWESIGRILLKGYVDTGVYPIQLSYAFSCAAIFGEVEVSGDILLESLRMYLSDTDRRVVDLALKGQELDEDDRDDFLDLLGRVSCHSIPSCDEIRPMLISIAHKELIQEPKYALDAISCIAGPSLKEMIHTPISLQEMYASKTPNPRKVIKLLNSSPANQEEAAALSFLKQFIKGLDDRMLKKFMRYITGSEFICIKAIEVTFNRMRGFARSPQIHTCGPLLELPSTYGSYPELRNELMQILDANYMNMDVV
jgi:hypothetical protein